MWKSYRRGFQCGFCPLLFHRTAHQSHLSFVTRVGKNDELSWKQSTKWKLYNFFLSPKFANDNFRAVLCISVSSVHKRQGKAFSYRYIISGFSRTQPDAFICRIVIVYDAKCWIFKWDVCQGPVSEISMPVVRTNVLVGVHRTKWNALRWSIIYSSMKLKLHGTRDARSRQFQWLFASFETSAEFTRRTY